MLIDAGTRPRPLWPVSPWEANGSIAHGDAIGRDDDDGLSHGKVVGDGEVDAHFVPLGREVGKGLERSAGELECWPAGGQIDHAHVAPEHPLAEAGAKRLGASLLGGKALGVGSGPAGAAVGLPPLGVGKHAGKKTVAVALDGTLHAPDIDDVVAEPEDHHAPPLRVAPVSLCRNMARAPSMLARMRRTLSSSPTKIASPIK